MITIINQNFITCKNNPDLMTSSTWETHDLNTYGSRLHREVCRTSEISRTKKKSKTSNIRNRLLTDKVKNS